MPNHHSVLVAPNYVGIVTGVEAVFDDHKHHSVDAASVTSVAPDVELTSALAAAGKAASAWQRYEDDDDVWWVNSITGEAVWYDPDAKAV